LCVGAKGKVLQGADKNRVFRETGLLRWQTQLFGFCLCVSLWAVAKDNVLWWVGLVYSLLSNLPVT